MDHTALHQTLLSIPVGIHSKKDIIENIKKNISLKSGCTHLVSLNPEHIILARKEVLLKKILIERSICINDGVGICLASRLLSIPCAPRITGVDLMLELLQYAGESGLSVMLIGSKNELADTLAKRYQLRFPHAHFIGMEGYKDIKSPLQAEEEHVRVAILRVKPDMVFAAFGAPWQEYWIDAHTQILDCAVCMGVGGGFDFVGGIIPRAPVLIRQIGFEWAYRLIRQPWRLYRQFALFQFIYLVIREKIFQLQKR